MIARTFFIAIICPPNRLGMIKQYGILDLQREFLVDREVGLD